MPRPKILIAQRYESGARMASRLFVGREYDKYMLDFAENLQMAINTMRHANDAGDPYRAVISSVLLVSKFFSSKTSISPVSSCIIRI